MSNEEEEIIQKLKEQAKHEPEITVEARDRAMIRILNQADTPDQIQNAWDCITKFYETTKAMGSTMQQKALQASVFINKFRATYEVYEPSSSNSDSERRTVDQSSGDGKADDSVL